MTEDLIEPVEVALVLHQTGAREVVEVLDTLLGEVLVQGFEQLMYLPQGDGDLGGA